MSAALMSKPLPTLIEAEETLQALLDTQDMADESMRDELEAEIAHAMRTAAAKRDRVAGALACADSRIAMIDAEIERLEARRDQIKQVKDRIELLVANVIMSLGVDAKGKLRKLEGNVSSLGLQRNPASVEVIDEASVPNIYKSAMVSMPWPVWEKTAEFLKIDADKAFELGIKQAWHVSRTEVRKALDAGEHVPGARIAAPKYRVVRK